MEGWTRCSELDLTSGDDAVDGRANHGTAEVNPRFVDTRLRQRHRGARGIEGCPGIACAILDVGQLVPRDGSGLDQSLASFQVDAGALDIGRGRRDLRSGAREVRLGLPQCQSGIGVIDHDQHVAALDLLAVDDSHLRYRPFDLGGHKSDLGGGIGVVCLHIAGSDLFPVNPIAGSGTRYGECEQGEQNRSLAAALGLRFLGRRSRRNG